LIRSDKVQIRVREIGAIYFKDMVTEYWSLKPSQPFCLDEDDKIIVRENLIDAIVQSPDPIREPLVRCVYYIAKSDFPEKWPTIVDKVHYFIQSPDINSWYGSLQAFYQVFDTKYK
jgi:hypothetical protein